MTDPKAIPLDYRGPVRKAGRFQDAESRRWRNWRILFRVGLFALIFLILAPPMVYFGSNQFAFDQWTRPVLADFIPIVQQVGVPSVRAIKEYQRDTGSFPASLDDLRPKYLPSAPSSGPYYGEWCGGGQYIFMTKWEHQITYNFTPGSEGWTIIGPCVNGPLPLPPVTIPPATSPATK